MFKNIHLRTKLLIAFLAIGIVPLAIIGSVAVLIARDALSKFAFGQLESVREVKKTHLEMFFQERERNMSALVETVSIFKQTAIDQMRSIQEVKKAQVEETVQQWMHDITVLSQETTLQDMQDFELLLDEERVVKMSTFDLFEEYHFGDSLQQFTREYGYADLLLITNTGDIAYTVKRGPDLGKNVLDGSLQRSSLNACFQQALHGIAVQDFAPYSASDNHYMAFVAAPVFNAEHEALVGIVTLKIDTRPINTIVQRRQGMGRSGETYLVGQQADAFSLRSDQIIGSGKIGDLVAGEEVEQVFAGRSDSIIKIGRSGNMEITRYDPLALPGLRWGLITSMRLEEVIAPRLEGHNDDYFARFITQYDYADLTLIHPDGTIFYTVAHAADYGTNLLHGPYADTGLGEGFRKALDSKAFAFSDFRPYSPAQGQPVAFMAQPIVAQSVGSDNEVELVIAVQIPIDVINTVMQERDGMGQTGETYLVGTNLLRRSDSALDPEDYSVSASFAAPENGRIDTRGSREALAGHIDKTILTNYAGQSVLSAYAPLQIWETTWAFIAEISTDEAFTAVKNLTFVITGITVVMLIATVGLSYMVSGYMTQPINHIVRIAQKVSEGDLSETIEGSRSTDDEISILIRAFQQVMTYLREMADVAASISGGDLRQQVTARSERDVLGQAFIGMTDYLRTLTAVATAIAGGELHQRIRPKSKHDVLGNAFHSMAVQLRENFARIQEHTVELTRTNTQLAEEIAERRRMEQVLRVSEKQYRMLAENVKDGIVIVQAQKLVFANRIFAAMMGKPVEHLTGCEPASLFHAQDKSGVTAWLRHGNDTSVHQCQAQLTTNTKQTIWTEIEQASIVWDGQSAQLLTIRDITGQKVREERLEHERARLQQENITLKSTVAERYKFGPLVGKSRTMQRVYELIVNATASEVNVLIGGESGTGKELIARTIHQASLRKGKPFVPVNCASIPETLFEREFFGHCKGTFTGADRDKPGLFDQAHQGTLFLDEVTELTPGAQAKLLRALQDGEYTPLGSTTAKRSDVLIVAATNKDWNTLIDEGALRQDFFYRICVIEINVPPLRERKEDLPLLIEHFLELYRRKQTMRHGSVPDDLPIDQSMLPGEFIQGLYQHDWPGNVRELQNILQRYLATRDLDTMLTFLGSPPAPIAVSGIPLDLGRKKLPEVLEALEKQVLEEALAKNQNHRQKTAAMLGIPERTLRYKLKKHGLAMGGKK